MALVGIIANPAASKDIRRLVAQGRVVPDWEKVNIVRRVLLGLQAVGIQRVLAMPDSSHLGERARDDGHLSIELDLLQMSAYYTENDTVRAAGLMEGLGVDCLVTLGGDGTNRAVAKGCASIPIVAVSTGTNNVFPTMVEGTLAGLVAGLVAQGRLNLERVSVVSKRLEVYVDGEYRDMALVDVALSKERFVATRAIWDIDTIYEVFLTRAEPASIGLSSVGARLQPVSLTDDGGLYYCLGGVPAPSRLEGARYPSPHSSAARGEEAVPSPSTGEGQACPGRSRRDGGDTAHGRGWFETRPCSDEGRVSFSPPDSDNSTTVLAPIAPGIIPQVSIAHWRRIANGERVPVARRYSTVALDGERAFSVTPQQMLEVAVIRNGPRVVQVDAALRQAAELGVFRV